MDHRAKIKEIEKRDNYLDLARKFKKPMEHGDDNDANRNGCFGTVPKSLEREVEELEIGEVETVQTIAQTEYLESPGDLRRLAVTQTPVTDHQFTQVWKTHQQTDT